MTPTTAPVRSSRIGPVTLVPSRSRAPCLTACRTRISSKSCARADQAVVGEAGDVGPRQGQAHAAADDPQALVADPAVLGGRRDAEADELLDRARGEAVAADLLAGEVRLLQQHDVEAGHGEVCRGGRPGGSGADDDDVGPLGRGGRSGGGRVQGGLGHGWPSRLLVNVLVNGFTNRRASLCLADPRGVRSPSGARTPLRGAGRPPGATGGWLRAGGPVEGDDAAGEVAPLDAGPARARDPLGQLALGRPGLDRLGQVDVGLRVAARPAGRSAAASA